jgi:hypothetical protein
MKLKRAVKIVAGLFLLGILAFVSMLAVFSWRHPNSVTLPAPTGPFSVGRQSFDWIDAGRIDPLAPADGSRLRIPPDRRPSTCRLPGGKLSSTRRCL